MHGRLDDHLRGEFHARRDDAEARRTSSARCSACRSCSRRSASPNRRLRIQVRTGVPRYRFSGGIAPSSMSAAQPRADDEGRAPALACADEARQQRKIVGLVAVPHEQVSAVRVAEAPLQRGAVARASGRTRLARLRRSRSSMLPSVLPLSDTTTSPRMPCSAIASSARRMHDRDGRGFVQARNDDRELEVGARDTSGSACGGSSRRHSRAGPLESRDRAGQADAISTTAAPVHVRSIGRSFSGMAGIHSGHGRGSQNTRDSGASRAAAAARAGPGRRTRHRSDGRDRGRAGTGPLRPGRRPGPSRAVRPACANSAECRK